jgi:hypothetical protein
LNCSGTAYTSASGNDEDTHNASRNHAMIGGVEPRVSVELRHRPRGGELDDGLGCLELTRPLVWTATNAFPSMRKIPASATILAFDAS